MATALNLTLKLKTDPESRRLLRELKDNFATHIQPKIQAALAESEVVHYARVLVTPGDEYIQVITEFDGPADDYTEYFRQKLPEVFKAIFALGEGMPAWDELNHRDKFLRVSRDLNIHSLGSGRGDEAGHGYLFSAYGNATVEQINRALTPRGAGAQR